MKKNIFTKFWDWYQRNYKINIAIAAGLFGLQLVHLFWLTTDVVILRLFGVSLFTFNEFWRLLIILVDYTEIPALVLTSLVYIHELRIKFNYRSILFLILLNSQWLHLFWITDEMVIEQFTGVAPILLPGWLSWMAIFIDYLELPVMVDTVKKTISEVFTKQINIKEGDLEAQG